jgi:hypothetical protein
MLAPERCRALTVPAVSAVHCAPACFVMLRRCEGACGFPTVALLETMSWVARDCQPTTSVMTVHCPEISNLTSILDLSAMLLTLE